MSEQKNLCDTCIYERETCDSGKQAYGPRNTVTMCDAYESDGTQEHPPAPQEEVTNGPEQQRMENISQSKQIIEAPNIDLGNCSACSEPLIVIQINSRVRGIVCKNRRCNLYYERIKTYSIPKPKVIDHVFVDAIRPHTHQYKGKDNHCIVPGCDHIRIRRNKKEKK